MMYEMIDECLNCGILVKIEVLNFMILHFKFSSLSFSLVCCLFSFKFCCDRVLHGEDLTELKNNTKNLTKDYAFP